MLGFVTLSACSLDSAYACASDAQCNDGENAGRCEFDGYCSFQDDTCPSGRRYGTWAPTAVANLCVDTTAAATSSTGSSTSSTTSSETSTATSDGSSEDVTTLAVTLTPTGDSTSSSSGTDAADSSSTGPTVVLDPDLVAWYRFDTIEDATITDHSGNDHLATCETCPSLVGGVYEDAIGTDGAGQHLVVAQTPALTTQTWTLAAWVWSDAAPTTFETVVGKPLGVGVANSYELGVSTSGMTPRIVAGWSDDLTAQGLSVPLPAQQQWFHVVATLSDTAGTLYLDGEVVDEEALVVTPAFDDSDLYIAADVDNLVVENFFFGRIDDLRIYRRALTIDEVAVIMTGENL